MSSIGKRIDAVIPELSRAKVLKQSEYEIKNWHTQQGTGQQIRRQELDLTGDGKADLVVERQTDLKTGRYSDAYTLENSTRIAYDKAIFHTDESGVIRHEFHRLGERQVNLWDGNRDGKLDGKSVSTGDGSLVERDDSNGDGVIDRERKLDRNGAYSERSIVTDPFFEDE